MDGINPLKVLDLPPNYTLEQLRNQYKRQVVKYHPDRTQDVSTTLQFQLLTACYKQLLAKLDARDSNKSHTFHKQEAQSFVETQQKRQSVNSNLVTDSRQKFDNAKFNMIFDENRLPDKALDSGYGKWMENPSSFKESRNTIQKYREPQAMTSTGLDFYNLGVERVADYSGDNVSDKDLNYMDYKVAYTTSMLDVDKVKKRREYKTVDELEADRSRIRFQMNDKEANEYYRRKKKEDNTEKHRLEKLEKRDTLITRHFEKTNGLMLGMR